LAKILVSRALNIQEAKFELHESNYLGWYYKLDGIRIKWANIRGDDYNQTYAKYRTVVETPSLEISQRIIDYYNSILVKGKPRF